MNAMPPIKLNSRLTADTAGRRIGVEVVKEIIPLEAEWRAFERCAAGTFYQTYDWCRLWFETVGVDRRVEPRIVLGRGEAGCLLFLLPLAIRRQRGCRVLEWLTSGELNYGYGLYDRCFLPRASEWFAAEAWRIVELAGPIDAILLRDMPERLHGFAHPLASWFSFCGRNSSYRLSLAGGFEDVHARKRSAESRRGQRKRDAKLAAIGELKFGLPDNRQELHAQLDLMFEQQRVRLGETGVHGLYGQAERDFIHRLADCADALLPFRLMVGKDMAAMMLGGNYGGTYWALISSLANGAARRHSPGDAALRRTIEACCTRGMTDFDFASGDTSYKAHWADEVVDLFETVRGFTLKGYIWAAIGSAVIFAKRVVKRSPFLWHIVSTLRKTAAGSRAAG
jgi:CelD/BcsL family acetyltransferase involved in cellulose biosynthesis